MPTKESVRFAGGGLLQMLQLLGQELQRKQNLQQISGARQQAFSPPVGVGGTPVDFNRRVTPDNAMLGTMSGNVANARNQIPLGADPNVTQVGGGGQAEFMRQLLTFAASMPEARQQLQLESAFMPQPFSASPGQMYGTVDPLTQERKIQGQVPMRTPIQPREIDLDRPTETVNGILYKWVQDVNAQTNDPIGQPRRVPWVQQNTAGIQSNMPVDDNLAKSIAEYKTAINSVASLRGNRREAIMNRVLELNPQFDMTQYASRQKIRTGFTSGKESANIRSLNTIAQHTDKLQEMGDALKNGDVTSVNAIANFFSKNLAGNPNVTNFNAAANAVASEAVTVFKNTGATDQEIEHVRDVVNSSSSPEQITGFIQTILDLVNGRIAALKNQWEAGMGEPASFKMMDDKTREIMGRYGLQPSDIGAGLEVGHVEDGYRFKGGDPTQQSNWEKVE